MYQNISGTKRSAEHKLQVLTDESDTKLLLNRMILFDINEIYGNKAEMKRLGTLIKSQEIQFDDPKIKMLISLRYQKVLALNGDEFSFYKSYNRILHQARQNRNYLILSTLYAVNAKFKIQINQRDSAVYYTNLSVLNARKQTDKLVLINSLIKQAELYDILKDEETSVSKSYVALQASVENNYKFGVYSSSMLIATINSRHQNYIEMQSYLDRALNAAESINFQHGIQYIILFGLDNRKRLFPDDISKFEEIKKKIDDDSELKALTYIISAKIDRANDNYTSALSKLNLAIIEYEKIEDLMGAQMVYQQISSILIVQKKYSNAIFYLNKSREILTRINYNSESTELLKIISETYEKEGNKLKALSYLKSYVRIKDSLQLADIQTNLLVLRQQNQVDKRERIITLQADSLKQQKNEREYTMTVLENIRLKNNLKTYIIIGFTGLILLGGIIIFFKWNQNLIQQHQKEAEMNQTLLRTQMNPHFVFNAMSVIQSYLYDNDTENSTKFLVNFSRLMRLILENSSKEFIPLKIEKDILEKYLNVQKIRFEDRFDFSILTQEDLSDYEEDIMIPPMITQPFIENSIEHGQLHLKKDGYIHVSFSKLSEQLLEIKVTDNGVGRKHAVKKNYNTDSHKSMAIGITRDRIVTLNKKYKTNGMLIIEDLDKINETGTVVTITIPYLRNV